MESALQETLRSIENAGKNPNIPFAVFKPTAFIPRRVLDKIEQPWTLTSDDHARMDLFKARVDKLCSAASQIGKPILVDAEDSWYQKFIDEITEQMMQRYNRDRAVVFNTLQMYRHDRLAFLKSQHQKAVDGNYYLGVKFVRGAYMEKERERAARMGYTSPIQPDKASTDRDFDAALTFCIENISKISIFCGTHNENSCLYLANLMQQHNIRPSDPRVWFSQLYGMSDHISFNMAIIGYNVAKYVPYGPVKHVIPYLARRAEENTSVKGQTGRELGLISKELIRRRQAKD
ncbi:MAG: proline dehydrogenase [Bacteroidetes bacterium HGW-Bacteroidetes-22]|nr:MAG: proline dehydrogenase [Bacteroidetes bacterium HGW-Bacteroidetes-22]